MPIKPVPTPTPKIVVSGHSKGGAAINVTGYSKGSVAINITGRSAGTVHNSPVPGAKAQKQRTTARKANQSVFVTAEERKARATKANAKRR